MKQRNHPPRVSLFDVLKDRKRFTQSRTDILMDVTLKHGDVVELPHPFEKLYTASHPLAVRHVLLDNAKNYAKSSEYEILGRWIGNSLIVSEGELWASDRKMLQPAFHRQAIQSFQNQIQTSVEQMLNDWKHRALQSEDGETFSLDVGEEMLKLALSIIGWRLFGKDISVDLEEMGRLMGSCQEHITDRMLKIDWAAFFPTPRERRFQKQVQRLSRLIKNYLLNPAPGSVAELMRAHRKKEGSLLTLEEQVNQMLGFLAAGHETSAVALTWALFLLSEHPHIQRSAESEEQKGSGNDYAEQIFEETLRLYPPVPCFGRVALEDDEIQGFFIPQGGTVVLPQFVTHRRPDLWKNADQFEPERFSTERRSEILKNAYYPFGLGQRVCIGQGLALLEGAITLQEILKEFEVGEVMGPKPQMNAQISLKPDRPVRIKFRKKTSRLPLPT